MYGDLKKSKFLSLVKLFIKLVIDGEENGFKNVIVLLLNNN